MLLTPLSTNDEEAYEEAEEEDFLYTPRPQRKKKKKKKKNKFWCVPTDGCVGPTTSRESFTSKKKRRAKRSGKNRRDGRLMNITVK